MSRYGACVETYHERFVVSVIFIARVILAERFTKIKATVKPSVGMVRFRTSPCTKRV
jgi:hypothetical protein